MAKKSKLPVKVKKKIEVIALAVVALNSADIPALGNLLNHLCELEKSFRKIGQPDCLNLTLALKNYLERIILREIADPKPLEEGVEFLQSICSCLSKDAVFDGDLSQILNRLGFKEPDTEKHQKNVVAEPVIVSGEGRAKKPSHKKLSEEDREIMGDFVIESLENLSTIELSLVNLEQNPEDLESINDIFRPFHTIKGVSGFLDLKKINQLAHSAESLLDKARNNKLRVEGTVIDIILESVDVLNKMIREVQEGLEKGVSIQSDLDTIPLVGRLDEMSALADQIQDNPLGEILVQKGAIGADDLKIALERQEKEPDRKIGEILVDEKRVDSKAVTSALREQKTFSRRHTDLQVKVDTQKLDNLMDLTGELVIAQAMLSQHPWIRTANQQDLSHTLNQLALITANLQTTAMSMRMVPIRNTFQKMVRLVRDLGKNAGKDVILKMTGEETEIDRNLVEELYQPMIHMIRNAVDHGIETPQERERAGKDKRGVIYLRACHRGDNIIVEIEDSGRGLDKNKILEKARLNHLVTEGSDLTDDAVFNLIFQPGLTTAQNVTDISGRGVGMDVVKKAIEKLGGQVKINSRPGLGTTFIISLPLTLAITETIVVKVAEERYLIPTLSILESFQPSKNQYTVVEGKGELLNCRGDLIPLFRLDSVFDLKGDCIDPWDGLVVTVSYEGKKLCLLIDQLLGKEEVVIKSLGESLKNMKGFAGGTIMGDGRVSLILDIADIFDMVSTN